MNKTDLIAAVAEKTALTKKDSAAAIDAVFDVIGTALQGKDKVNTKPAKKAAKKK